MSDIDPAALKPFIASAIEGPLSREDAEAAFGVIMSGKASAAQIGGFLMILRMRGEAIEEIAGAAAAMRAKALRVSAPDGAMDVVGTGGDGKKTLNISTAAALIVAGAGVPVAKHGNKALSSQSGASDAFGALGVNLNTGVEGVEASIREAGIGYMHAANHHAAMRFVMPARVELGTRTVFNILGPLTNPAGAKRQLTGAFSRAMIRPMAETLRALGSEAAWLVHGADGTDEISICGPTYVAAFSDGGEVREFEITPKEAGIQSHPFEAIIGGSPDENVAALRDLLGGAKSAYRDAAAFNAAAALHVAGKAPDLRAGAELAYHSIDTGAAGQALEALIRITNQGNGGDQGS